MRKSQLRSTLPRRKRQGCAMKDYDKLPAHLRRWIASAALPWRAGSVLRCYEKALKRTGDPKEAIAELDRIQAQRVAKDAAKLWDGEHPCTLAA